MKDRAKEKSKNSWKKYWVRLEKLKITGFSGTTIGCSDNFYKILGIAINYISCETSDTFMDLPDYLENIEHLIKNSFTLKKVWVYWYAYKKRKIWPNFSWNNKTPTIKHLPHY